MDRLAMLIAVARGLDIVPLVRVPKVDYQMMSRPFEVGAMGTMVPAVETRKQAQAIVAATKHPPEGRRGTAFGIVHDGYRKGDAAQTMREANEQTLVIAQIETLRGIEDVEGIASVEGIDVLWIGHMDLTTSLGITGQFDHPDYNRALRRLLEACEKTGRAPGGFRCDSTAHGAELIAQGFRCLAYLNDIVIYRESLASGLARCRHRRSLGRGRVAIGSVIDATQAPGKANINHDQWAQTWHSWRPGPGPVLCRGARRTRPAT